MLKLSLIRSYKFKFYLVRTKKYFLQITTIVLSVIVFFMSVAEVLIKNCSKYNYYDYYDLTTRCFYYGSWGVGMWGSVLVSIFKKKKNTFIKF